MKAEEFIDKYTPEGKTRSDFSRWGINVSKQKTSVILYFGRNSSKVEVKTKFNELEEIVLELIRYTSDERAKIASGNRKR